MSNPGLVPAATKAMEYEVGQLLKMHSWQPLHAHEQAGLKKPIRSHMFMREKYDSEGRYLDLRGRLVGGGNQQPRGDTLHEDVSSPTAAMPFIFCVASIAAAEERIVVTADVPSAYLHADNSRHGITMILDAVIAKVVVKVDTSYSKYVRVDGTIVVKLKKAIYGCIESARLWYNLLRSILEHDGYIANPLEPCILNKKADSTQVTVVIYVDDLKFTCTNRSLIDATIAHVEAALGTKLKVKEGSLHSYLYDMGLLSQGRVSR
jgi:hypothetical protein